MARPVCWVIDNYEYRPCNHPTREFKLPVALHGHSYHSVENIGRMNDIMQKPVLKQINQFFNRAFRNKAHDDLDFSDIHYSPPLSPEDVYNLELESVKEFGFDEILLAITDHDKIAGCQELMESRPDLTKKISISEELSFTYENHVIHLGVHGIPVGLADEIHKNLQQLAKRCDHDGIFELLHEKNCLVILNHPLWELYKRGNFESAIQQLLKRYLWAFHAFEFNGLRYGPENDAVIELARKYNVPLIGGGDRHTPLPSIVFTATREAETFEDFIEEVKEGSGIVICKNDYFLPLGWKMFVRILQYVQVYRKIVFYKNIPLTSYPIPERMLPDLFADISSFIIKILDKLHLVR